MDRQGVKQVCLALPAATLDHPWDPDHDAYKVGGKMFAVIGGRGGIRFKVSDIAYEVLTQSGRAGQEDSTIRGAPSLARAFFYCPAGPTASPCARNHCQQAASSGEEKYGKRTLSAARTLLPMNCWTLSA